MDDLLNEFLTETSEAIDIVDVELVKLEQDPANSEVLDHIFRLVHTIKGTCGFIGLPRLEAIAHSAENILGKFRDGALKVKSDHVTLILSSLDRIKMIIDHLEANASEPNGDDQDLIEALDTIAERAEQSQTETEEILGRPLKPGEVSLEDLEAVFAATPGPEESGDDSLIQRLGGERAVAACAKTVALAASNESGIRDHFMGPHGPSRTRALEEFILAVLREDADEAKASAALVSDGTAVSKDAIAIVQSLFRACLSEEGIDKLVVAEAEDQLEIAAAMLLEPFAGNGIPSDGANNDKAPAVRRKSAQSIRVSVDLLEELMMLVSELVLTRNQLLQIVRHKDDSEFAVPLQTLSQCTTELQEGVMKTRMQPIGNAWAKLPRIVRDLSHELGKSIELRMKGENTELDRQLLELIKDPLTHMVRNSADHGIESPEERKTAGKPEKGCIELDAYHEGGHIILVIADDGKGIDAARLRAKLIENKLVEAEDLDGMSDAQVHKFIFHPGLSTAEEVTSVSGRGVGMDVVRSNIEKIGGTIDLHSEEGLGTRVTIKIPLTLAIVSALIVEAGGNRFALPQISVLELVRANGAENRSIEYINDTAVFRLRDHLLPLISLSKLLGVQAADTADSGDFIIVTQVGAFTFGIIVDRVFDTEEIVVKPVAPVLNALPVYSGNTILGDGSVIMILDPNGIAQSVTQVAPEIQNNADELDPLSAQDGDKETMLLFTVGDGAPKAVPLALVARLEEFQREQIEFSNGQMVVQYRDGLLPLLSFGDTPMESGRDSQPVLVFSYDGKALGLAVDSIMDIVDCRLDIELAAHQPGIIGTAVIADKVTEIVDAGYFMEKAYENWLVKDRRDRISSEGQHHLLLVDDSSFFRNLLKPLLIASGYQVTTASNAGEALELRRRGHVFDLIVSDIDMPDLDGFAFAEKVKSEGQWQETPLIALSGLHSPEFKAQGQEAGFSDYVAKMDRPALLKALHRQLESQTEDAA